MTLVGCLTRNLRCGVGQSRLRKPANFIRPSGTLALTYSHMCAITSRSRLLNTTLAGCDIRNLRVPHGSTIAVPAGQPMNRSNSASNSAISTLVSFAAAAALIPTRNMHTSSGSNTMLNMFFFARCNEASLCGRWWSAGFGSPSSHQQDPVDHEISKHDHGPRQRRSRPHCTAGNLRTANGNGPECTPKMLHNVPSDLFVMHRTAGHQHGAGDHNSSAVQQSARHRQMCVVGAHLILRHLDRVAV